MKTMGAETAEDSTGLQFDSDGIDCDFSISLVDILAILDEEPQSQLPDPSVSQGSADGFQHGDHFDLEKPFRSQAESTMNQVNFRVIGHSQSNLENASASKRETGLDFLPQSQGNFSDIPDRGAHVSLHSSHDQSNWLRLSYANNYAMNEHGGSSLFSQNFAELHVPNDIAKDAGLIYPPAANVNDLYVANVNDLYVNGELERNEIQEHGTFFSTACRESQVNVKNICSSSKLQNGETGTSHGLPIEIFFSSGGVQSCMSSVALPESTVEDGNLYSSLSCIDPDASAPDIFNPDVNNFEATNNICDGSNSFFPRVSCMNAEFYLDQTGSDQYSPLHSTINEKLVKTEDHLLPSRNSYWRGDLKLSTKEESPDSTLPDVLTDMGLSSTEELYSEYNDSDDMSLISESSTDSSPVPFSRNSLSTQVDGSVLRGSNSLLSGPDATWPNKPRPFMKDEMGDQMLQSCHKHQGDQLLRSCPKQHSVLKDGSGAVQNNLSRSTISLEDTDICILDDISDPVCPRGPLARLKQHPIAQRSGLNAPHYRAIGGMGLGANDERVTLRMALEDLSQPMSEASPPDGVLAVPLLRHQQIALSWMVQKETNLNCAGGILADDQGLGKTVSTIALILTERSPSSQHLTVSKKENEFEALNLDDDDDDTEISVKQPRSCISMIMRKSVHKKDPGTVLKGRPAAGTLVVCPTSVLRQWADELQSKVTSIANLSFLVYHGSNRTKDPNELAKYDVVLTTYAIVSMEVPKQPLVDKDDEEKGKKDASGASNALLNSKKRKTPTSDSKFQKGIGTTDGTLLESTARPLGRVGWFRVVLDEAQSIKNHRTQVARACWGLRAKRRWCLSGTPIQNAIDDLYSYFRFLRFDPYAAYQKFCSTIKIPISRNPTKGYKKLQTVLKTIMLRRTKGTLLDGKPIVSLPLKTISLEKVDFSVEERQFYSALEAESREQFMEYEDAGTVKQNYVNILLMLLRLRQACDHPLLVKGCESNSSLRSSMEKVKKLPRDKKIILLSCLEVSLAICTICNDPPEDAVVTICGHVFCNQCICEHLTAEENICPSPNCKERLSAASVFSRRTLQCSLSDHLGDGCSSGNSDFESGDKHKNRGMNWSSYSSKIKAAVEILRSLPKSQCCSKSNVKIFGVESFNSSVNPSNAVSESSSVDSSSVKQTSYVSEKAIVFSQWTRMLDLLEIPLQESCIHYRRLDGTMSVAARDKAIKDFNTLPEVTVIIMSLKAASLGLNLVAANHVLLLDLWWNPTTEDQAIDRAHRIGQTRPVTVSRLTVKDTVEDKILRLQEKKRVMVASAFGEDDSGSRQTRLTVEDLRYLFT